MPPTTESEGCGDQGRQVASSPSYGDNEKAAHVSNDADLGPLPVAQTGRKYRSPRGTPGLDNGGARRREWRA